MRSNKETFKKKIGCFCVVAACSKLIKNNRKHSRVSNIRKSKYWVKSRLAEKYKILYHGLRFELLLQDKEEFRMFLRMNTQTPETSN